MKTKTKQLALPMLRLLAAALAFGGSSALATTRNVPGGGYPTIQDAVNASNPGDIIQVAPGDYVENVNIPVASLTINGAQAGTAVATRVSGGPVESTVSGANPVGANPVFRVNAANVTIDGFTVKNAMTSFAAIGIAVKVTGDNAVIMNNIIDGIITPDLGVNGTAQAIYLEAGPDNVQILGNDMKNVHSNLSAKGVTIGDGGSFNPSQNVLIQGNSIANITSDSKGAYGISNQQRQWQHGEFRLGDPRQRFRYPERRRLGPCNRSGDKYPWRRC